MTDKDDINDLSINSNPLLEGNPIIDLINSLDMVKDKIPLKELAKRSIIDTPTIASLVAMYSISGFSKGEQLFRRNDCAVEIHSDIWSRIIAKKALNEEVDNVYPKFNSSNLNKEFIEKLKHLTNDPNRITEVFNILKTIGIVLIIELTIKGSKTDGVVGKTMTGRPYIGLSLRHYRLDNFWFTLFHELGHVNLHLDDLDTPIIDSFDNENKDENKDDKELEADMYARNMLIPRAKWNRTDLKFGKHGDSNVVKKVASDLNIHPAIVAGRIRHETGNFKLHASLVTEFNVRKLFGVEE